MAVYYASVPTRMVREVFRVVGQAPDKSDEQPVHVIVFDNYAEYFDVVQKISEEQYKKSEKGKDDGKA